MTHHDDIDFFELAPSAYVVVDLAGPLLRVNARFSDLFNMTSDVALTKTVADFVHPTYRRHAATLTRAMLRGEVDSITTDMLLMRGDGGTFWGNLDGKLVFDETGSPLYFLGALSDVSRKIEAVNARQDVELFAQRLVATVSHELRAPLHAMMGIAELISYSSDEALAERGRTMVQLANSQQDLIDDILSITRLQSGTEKLTHETFSPRRLLVDVGSTVESLVPKGVEFVVAASSSVPANAFGPRAKIQQVLVNLASNACKYTEAGTIEVKLTSSGPGRLTFSVSDTGTGIRPEHRVRIFNAFEQPDGGRGGVGLGLAISQAALDLMGSKLELESEPGKGSRFWFDLELDTAASETRAADPLTKRASGRSSAAVLVVDDNPINRTLAQAQLEQLGYEAVLAADGAAALELLAATRFDAVLMDWHMPNMDGLETTRRLRALEQHHGWRRTPVLAVTARAMEGDREACLEAGMDDFVAKPVSLASLSGVLERNVELPSSQTQEQQAAPRQPEAETGADEPNPEPSRHIDARQIDGLVADLGDRDTVLKLVQTFMSDLAKQVGSIVAAVEAGNTDACRRLAHTLKSSSRLLGATGLAAVCERIELDCAEGQAVTASSTAELVAEADGCARDFEAILADAAAASGFVADRVDPDRMGTAHSLS
ncbi:MAG: response regulator [Acidimicrobiales bacterium]|nr:response regulator [Acidimicrobiales bacterium]